MSLEDREKAKIEIVSKSKFTRDRKSVPNTEIMAIGTVNESKESVVGVTNGELDLVPTLLYTTPTPDCERRSTCFNSSYSVKMNFNNPGYEDSKNIAQATRTVANFKLESDV